MNNQPDETEKLRRELEKGPVEIRCAGGCGKLIHRTSWGSIDPRKLEVRCHKCERNLMLGDWQVVLGEVPISVFIYRCTVCSVTYEKVFYGSERLCKGCKVTRAVFVATNANPAVLIDERGAA